MSTQGQKQKRVMHLLNDMTKMGSIKGFKYFCFHIRGREELIVTVMNTPQSITPLRSPTSSYGKGDMLSALGHGPSRNVTSLVLSSRTQRRLSGYGYMNVGLPPASPSESEQMPKDENSTMFLIAGYKRYSCPYVWVRSNHQRLMRESDEKTKEANDSPLKMKSTSAWAQEDIKLWDILDELVDINTFPHPTNPFAVDFNYFQMCTDFETMLGTAAMINMLQKVVDAKHPTYADDMLSDIRQLGVLHFLAVRHLEDVRGAHDNTGNSHNR
eukprot:m.67851 g.67851  ORF g.67851 m.67851 type:complete len:270 (-) comp23880_c0_seq2:20-829(-)